MADRSIVGDLINFRGLEIESAAEALLNREEADEVDGG